MQTKTIRINWAAILAFCTFWTYAFYAAVSGHNKAIFSSSTSTSVLFFIGSSLILTSIFIFFLVAYFYEKKIFEDELKYSIADRNVLILYLLVMLLLSWPELNNQIYCDQLSHSMVALMHSIQGTYIAVKIFSSIDYFDFKNIMYVINVLLLIFSLIFIGVTSMLSKRVKIIIYFFVFLLFRFIVIYLGGGYQDVHPPLRLLPIWLSSTILYPSNLSLRVPQLLGFVVLMFISYKFACRYFSTTKSILFAGVLGSIPMLWHVGILVEPSIWSSLCVTYLLYCLLNKAFDENYTFNLMRVSSVVSIGVLLRQPNFACVFLLGVIFVYSYCYENKFSWRKFMIYLSPLLISIPFVFKSIFIGTPSTDPVTAGSTFSGVIFSVTSKIGLYSMVNGALYWIIFIPFILLIYRKNKIIALSIFSFLVIDYISSYRLYSILFNKADVMGGRKVPS